MTTRPPATATTDADADGIRLTAIHGGSDDPGATAGAELADDPAHTGKK